MDLVSTLSSQIQLDNKVDLLVSLLSMFSSVLLGVFTVLAVILGFLVWKQKDLLNKAEGDVKKIDDLKREIERAWEIVEELVTTARQSYDDLQEVYNSMKGKLGETNNLVTEASEQVSKRTTEANMIMNKASENLGVLLKEIEQKRNSLATVAPPNLRSYSSQTVKKAQELLRSEHMEGIKSRLDDYLKP